MFIKKTSMGVLFNPDGRELNSQTLGESVSPNSEKKKQSIRTVGSELQ